MKTYFRIGELARSAEVPESTLRYYERIGLLQAPARAHNAYRLYDDKSLRRLRFIRQAQRLGFSLDEIKEILGLRTRGACPCGRVQELAHQRLHQMDQALSELQSFRDELAASLLRWESQSPPASPPPENICPLIESTPNIPEKDA